MLTIQPVSQKGLTSNISFRQLSQEDLEKERKFYEDQRKDLDNMLNDSNISNKFKKPLKVMRVLTDGAVDGIAVTCAGIAGAKYGKDTVHKLGKTKFGKNVAKQSKRFGGYVANIFKKLGTVISNGFAAIKETKFGKKVDELSAQFAQSRFGKPIADFTKKVGAKIAGLYAKVARYFKGMSYDKGARNVSTGLGVCSAVGGAYSSAVENSKKENIEQNDVDSVDDIDEDED